MKTGKKKECDGKSCNKYRAERSGNKYNIFCKNCELITVLNNANSK